jgi:TP901 family phage tail tape measure protein
MPIAYQDLYLLLRAENLGTSAITSFGGMVEALGARGKMTAAQIGLIGTALVTAGTVVTAAGAVGLKFWYDSIKAAEDYQQQVRYTETQAGGLHISLKQLGDIGLEVAKKIATPLDTIQTGMYNIVSTLKVNYSQLKTLTTDFAKAAVAGQSDISDVSKITIGELHAYHLPLKDINWLLNQQFEMVKEGRGTYDDFIGVVGNAIPIYAASKNSIQEMGANIAFLTQNSLSAGTATAAASRAVEAITKADFQKGMKALGISFLDAHGHAKQLDTIVQEIADSPKWAKLVQQSGGSITKAFIDTFGGGTIQARRFFDLALARYPQLQGILDKMNHPGNALGRAYKLMSNTTEAQVQLLKNNFKALEITLGTDVLPVFNKFLHYIERLMHWFDGLSPGTKKLIAFGSLFASIAGVIGGATLIMTGFFLKFLSVIMKVAGAEDLTDLFAGMKGMASGMADGALAAAPYIAAILAVAAAVYFAIKYHKQIWEWMQKVWHDAMAWVDRAKDSFERLWKTSALLRDAIKSLPIFWLIKGIIELVKHHKDLEQWAKDAWQVVKDGMNDVKDVAMDVANFFETTWDAVFSWFSTNWTELSELVEEVWYIISNTIKIAWNATMDILKPGMEILHALFSFTWRVLATTVEAAWTIISGAVRDGMKIIMTIVDGGWGVLHDLWDVIWDTLSFVVKTTWDVISGLIKAAWSVIEGIFTVALDLLTGHWSKAWNDMKHYFGQAWHDIENMLISVMSNLVKVIEQVVPRLWNAALTLGKTIINALYQGVILTWHLIDNFFKGIVKVLVAFFAGLWDAMYAIGKDLVKGLWKGIEDTWHLVKDGLGHLAHGLEDVAKDALHIFSPSKVFYDIGTNVSLGLANGISDSAPKVSAAANKLLKSLPTGFNKFNNTLPTGSLANAQRITLVNVVMPKGMVTIQVSSALSNQDNQKMQKETEETLDKFTDDMVAKLKKVTVGK